MNEIVFRLWDNKRKKMIGPRDILDIDAYDYTRLVYTDILTFAVGSDGCCLYLLDSCGNYVSVDINDYIPMLYTGCKDIDGQEIYDSDIVEFDFADYCGLKGTVKFIGSGFKIVSDNSFTVPLDEARKVKVIGNVYECIEV